MLKQFVELLETLYPEIEQVNHLITHSWGQKVVRFYDVVMDKKRKNCR